MDISKLKVPDLKKELKSRGLNVSGNKNELVERLQCALKSSESAGNESVDDLDEDLLNEEEDDDVPLETTESVISDIDTALSDSSQKGQKRKSGENMLSDSDENKSAPPPKKLVLNRNILIDANPSPTESKEEEEKSNESSDDKKIIKLSEMTAKERLEMRAKKFDVGSLSSLSTEAKKIVRAERFGGNKITVSNGSNKIDTSNINTSVDVLKQRAERFGGSVSKAMTSIDNQEKMEKRKARFGIVTDADKAKQRLERFKQPVK